MIIELSINQSAQIRIIPGAYASRLAKIRVRTDPLKIIDQRLRQLPIANCKLLQRPSQVLCS